MQYIKLITGTQHLYGEEIINQVNIDSSEIASFFSSKLKVGVNFSCAATTREEITEQIKEANSDSSCIGVITWMHTFSPSKMWIEGLMLLDKPLLHLNTQINRNIPWREIDMNYMNLHQSAHGDREHGFITARLKIKRKVVAGYYQDESVLNKISSFIAACKGYAESRNLKVIRFGDNMRDVAVTEGDKIEAQKIFGWSVNTYGVSDLAKLVDNVAESAADNLVAEYKKLYHMETNDMDAVKYQAKIEIAIKTFLENSEASAFTTTFEDLATLKQLPGLAVQRLMAEGFGFAGEGDFKTAALVRIMKAMSDNTSTTFMEDYTYHLDRENEAILGAHMLEVCPTVANGKPEIQVHPLSIGGKEPPARLVFDGKTGPAICACVVDMGGRFRMIVNDVLAVEPLYDMPKLPVARVMWKPYPDLVTSAESWIYAGGAHHTSMSYCINSEVLRDFADMCGIEYILIDKNTTVPALKQSLLYSELIFR